MYTVCDARLTLSLTPRFLGFNARSVQAGAQKLQLARPTASRGRRKRAADFFGEELLTSSSEQPKATSGTEVLENAYHAAMALTAVPIRRTEPSFQAEPCSKDGVLDATDSRSQRRSDSSAESLSESESSRTKPASGKGSPVKMTAPDAAEGFAGGAQRDESQAVEAEGLIWVDPSQRTAYSVRCVCVCVVLPSFLALVCKFRVCSTFHRVLKTRGGKTQEVFCCTPFLNCLSYFISHFPVMLYMTCHLLFAGAVPSMLLKSCCSIFHIAVQHAHRLVALQAWLPYRRARSARLRVRARIRANTESNARRKCSVRARKQGEYSACLLD